MSTITASRYHDISCGHRVYGHENKCKGLHGHNHRVHFNCLAPELDHLGRVIDFSVIKSKLCMWIECFWDHKMMIWDQDPILPKLVEIDPESICPVPFNPTAENMAKYLVEVVGPRELEGTGVTLQSVVVEETRKCSATFSL